MLIGFISGAYSSVCVATSIWVTWNEHISSDRNRKAKETKEAKTEKKLKAAKA